MLESKDMQFLRRIADNNNVAANGDGAVWLARECDARHDAWRARREVARTRWDSPQHCATVFARAQQELRCAIVAIAVAAVAIGALRPVHNVDGGAVPTR